MAAVLGTVVRVCAELEQGSDCSGFLEEVRGGGAGTRCWYKVLVQVEVEVEAEVEAEVEVEVEVEVEAEVEVEVEVEMEVEVKVEVEEIHSNRQ